MAPRKRSRLLLPSSSSAPPPAALRIDKDTSPEQLGIHLAEQSHRDRFDKLKVRDFESTRSLDVSALDALGVREEIEGMAATLGWTDFLYFRAPTYVVLTLEFLSTLEAKVTSGHGYGRASFRLRNETYTVSFAYVNEMFGFSQLEAPSHENRVIDFNASSFYNEIAFSDGPEGYNAKRTKASSVYHPCLRILQRFMAHTIFGRGDGENGLALKEVLFLWSLLYHQPLNSAGFMLNHMKTVGHKDKGKIVIGSLVTHIARQLNVDLGDLVPLPYSTPIGLALFKNMKLIHEIGGRYYCSVPRTKKLVRLPCPSRTDISHVANWRFPIRDSDKAKEDLLYLHQLHPDAEEEEEDEDEDDDTVGDDFAGVGPNFEHGGSSGYAPDPPLHAHHAAPDPPIFQYAPPPSTFDIYGMMQSQQDTLQNMYRLQQEESQARMAYQSNVNARFDSLDNSIAALQQRFNEWNFPGWQPGPPPPQ